MLYRADLPTGGVAPLSCSSGWGVPLIGANPQRREAHLKNNYLIFNILGVYRKSAATIIRSSFAPLFIQAQEKKNSKTWQSIEGDLKPGQKITVDLKEKRRIKEGLWTRESGDVPNKWKKQQIKAKEKVYNGGAIPYTKEKRTYKYVKWIQQISMMFPVCVTEYVLIITSSLHLTRPNSYSVYGWTHLSYGKAGKRLLVRKISDCCGRKWVS